MKAEKGGIIHIIFIFIGLGLICFGTFYFFTDNEKIDNEKEEKEEKQEDKDIINQINLMNNVETSITLKNKKEIKIKYLVDEDTSIGSFYLNNNFIFKTSSELEFCDKFYIYNDSIVGYCTYGSTTSGHLYVVYSNETFTEIKEFSDNTYRMIPESVQVKNGKLVVNGIRVYEGAILKEEDKEINLCDKDAILENNVDLKSHAHANYELTVNNNKPEFTYMETTKTLEEFIEESCKTVE